MTDRGLPEGAIDLGHKTFYTKKVTEDGRWVGIYEWHDCRASERNSEVDYQYDSGYIPFTGRGDWPVSWEVEQEEPLTLSPSLACRMCGHHGFIRNGRWESV